MILGIDREDTSKALLQDNPWWAEPERDPVPDCPRTRAYFPALLALARQREVRRSVVLMGSRRVGKTVMLLQLVRQLIRDRFPAGRIFYVSLDSPIYHNQSLERLLDLYRQEKGCSARERSVVIFDEIQYLKDWEVHLKVLTDKYPAYRFIVSGSAGAALKRKSAESGAGRFTDFMLPPLAFAEYLRLSGLEDETVEPDLSRSGRYRAIDMERLNRHFVEYLNFGGYPEPVLNPAVRQSANRFLYRDVVDKILLRDLPSLYGVQDVQELNRLFAFVAYRSGQEISPRGLSKNSNVTQGTVRRYLQYLETAFLTVQIPRVDDTGKTFQRTRTLKVYLTNPSIRSALYGPLGPDDNGIGHQAETAVVSQWAHSEQLRQLRYARWKKGRREVDLVRIGLARQKPDWACEVKWSDSHVEDLREISGLLEFAGKNRLPRVYATTRTRTEERVVDGVSVEYVPCALHCYEVGRREIESLFLMPNVRDID